MNYEWVERGKAGSKNAKKTNPSPHPSPPQKIQVHINNIIFFKGLETKTGNSVKNPSPHQNGQNFRGSEKRREGKVKYVLKVIGYRLSVIGKKKGILDTDYTDGHG